LRETFDYQFLAEFFAEFRKVFHKSHSRTFLEVKKIEDIFVYESLRWSG